MAPHTALDTDTWYRHAFLNRLQSFLLIGIMAAFLGRPAGCCGARTA